MAQPANDLQVLFDLLDSHAIERSYFQVRLICVGLAQYFAAVHQKQSQPHAPQSPRQDAQSVQWQPGLLDVARFYDDVDILKHVVQAIKGPWRDVDKSREAVRVAADNKLHALDLKQWLEETEHLSGLFEPVGNLEVIVRDNWLVIAQVIVRK